MDYFRVLKDRQYVGEAVSLQQGCFANESHEKRLNIRDKKRKFKGEGTICNFSSI